MPHRPFLLIFAALLVFMSATTTHAVDKGTTLARPVDITFQTIRNRRLTGKLVSYDAAGFEYKNVLNLTRRVKWDDVTPQTDYLIHKKVMANDNAKAWFRVGQRLLKREGGANFGKQALDAAVRLDPSLREPAETVKKDPNAVVDLSPPKQPTNGDTTNTAENHGETNAPPVPVFKGNARPWKMLDAARTKGVVYKLKVTAEAHGKKLGVEFSHTESHHFLIYSDLPISQISKYGALLDRADQTLSSMFGLKRDAHVWYGKAVVFIFSKRANYQAFEEKIYFVRNVKGDSSLHRQGDGSVIIAAHRKADGAFFDDELVRAATKGYMYRYISNLRLAAWLDDGLSGYVAKKIVPRGPTAAETNNKALSLLLNKHGKKLGNQFFTARTLEPWQQSAATGLVTHMIQRNDEKFAAFATALKAGYTWQVGFEQFYEKPEADLLKQWGNSLGIGVIMR